jgi:membrane protein DedA with SNARE-associated domain
VVAFLVPILVFIGALAGFGWLLEDTVDARYQMPVAAALALAATTGVMLVLRVATRRHQKK